MKIYFDPRFDRECKKDLFLINKENQIKFLIFKYFLFNLSLYSLHHYINNMNSDIPYFNDDRTPNEVMLTNKLIQILSQQNISNLSKKQYPCLHKNKNILTIAINGLPYNKLQFQGFQFPGTFINYFPPGSQPTATDQFYKKRLSQLSQEFIVKQIDALVQKHSGKVILVYHSYGTYYAALYSHYYPQKVVGLIQFGAIGINPHPLAQHYYLINIQLANQEIDIDQEWKLYQDNFKKQQTRTQFNLIQNKYILRASRLFLQSVFRKIFQFRRNMPKVLKLIAFGQSDKIIPVSLLNSSATYYTYGINGSNFLDSQYQKKLINRYTQITGVSTKNLQQKFIFGFPKTGHGVHLKKKKELQEAMNLYLALILADISQKPKL